MNCNECDKSYPSEYNYCPECGAPKGETCAESLDKERVDRRRLAELAIAERVFKKVLTWLGVLATSLVIGLAILGLQVNSFLRDTRQQVEFQAQQTLKVLKAAEEQARPVIEGSKSVQSELEKARRIVADVRKLRTDVDSIQSQVENFYQTIQHEVFGGKQNAANYSGGPDKWALKLKQTPIPTSLRVLCGGMELYPHNYRLSGNTLTVNCSLELRHDSPESEQDFIIVTYHPRK